MLATESGGVKRILAAPSAVVTSTPTFIATSTPAESGINLSNVTVSPAGTLVSGQQIAPALGSSVTVSVSTSPQVVAPAPPAAVQAVSITASEPAIKVPTLAALPTKVEVKPMNESLQPPEAKRQRTDELNSQISAE